MLNPVTNMLVRLSLEIRRYIFNLGPAVSRKRRLHTVLQPSRSVTGIHSKEFLSSRPLMVVSPTLQ